LDFVPSSHGYLDDAELSELPINIIPFYIIMSEDIPKILDELIKSEEDILNIQL